jgi:hypothetical protein
MGWRIERVQHCQHCLLECLGKLAVEGVTCRILAAALLRIYKHGTALDWSHSESD